MYRRSVSCLAALLVAVVLSAAGPAKAAVVTFSYEGSITEMTDIMASGPFSIGDPLSFSFSFESTTPDSNPGDPAFANYLGAVTSYTVTAGSYTAEGLFNTGDIEIRDGSGLDSFVLSDSFPSGLVIAGRFPTLLTFSVTNPDHDLFSSDALPATPPGPGPNTFLRFDLTFTDQSGATGDIRSRNLVPVSVVPLPAALPLFLSALAGLGFFGWRKRAAA